MSTIDDAVDTAARAAGAAIHKAHAMWPWWQYLADRELTAPALAGFVERQPDAPAEALYRFVAGRRVHRNPWNSLTPDFRVAFEIFRAAFLALLPIARADAAAAAEKARASGGPLPNRGMGRRYGMAPKFGQRHVMSRTPRRDFAVSAPLEPSAAGAVASSRDEPAVMGLETESAPAEPATSAFSPQTEAPAHSAPASALRKGKNKRK